MTKNKNRLLLTFLFLTLLLPLSSYVYGAESFTITFEENGGSEITDYQLDIPVLIDKPTQTSPVSTSYFAAGDYNNDGLIDLTYYSWTDQMIYVSESIGEIENSMFMTATGIENALLIYMEDLNGDGYDDVIPVERDKSTITWLESDGGNINIEHTIPTSAQAKPATVMFLDWNEDGDMDLVTNVIEEIEGSWHSSYYYYENNGDESFTETLLFSEILYYTLGYTALVDLDGDGDHDFVSVFSEDLKWIENTGNRVFDESHSIEIDSTTIRHFTVSDLTKDGLPDIIFGGQNTNTLGMFVQQPDHTFQLSLIDENLTSPTQTELIDINEDGLLDILVGSNNTSTFYSIGSEDLVWYLNNGNNTFTRQEAIEYRLKYMSKFLLVDYKNDGDLDIVVPSSESMGILTPTTFFYDTSLSDSYTITTTPVTPEKEGYVFVGWFPSSDFAGEPMNTIPTSNTEDITLYAKWEVINNYVWLDVTDDVTGLEDTDFVYTIEDEPITLPTPERSGYSFGGWYVDDSFVSDPITEITYELFKEDDSIDLYPKWINNQITFDSLGGSAVDSILLPIASGLQTKIYIDDANDVKGTILFDVDNDSDLDMLLYSSDEDYVVIFEQNELYEFDFLTEVSISYADPQNVVTIDYDNDNDLDLVIGYNDDSIIAWYENIGDGDFIEYLLIDTELNYLSDIEIDDFDQDDDYDIVIVSKGDQSGVWYENIDNSIYIEHFLFSEHQGANDLHLSDLNGDGYTDVLFTYANTGDGGLLLYINNTEGGFNEYILLENHGMLNGIATGDIDGDELLDIVVSTNSGKLTLLLNQGDNTYIELQFGVSSDYRNLTIADYNQDGDMDVLGGSNNMVFVYYGDGTGDFSELEFLFAVEEYRNMATLVADLDNDEQIELIFAFDDIIGSIEYSVAKLELEEPTKTDYIFDGWYTDKTFTTEYIIDLNQMESITLYAKWIGEYTITFDTNGGTEISSIIATNDSDITWPNDPEKANYIFDGWFVDENYTEEYLNFSTMPNGDVTLYAKWTANQYTISFDTDGGSVVADITQDFGTAVTAPTDPTQAGYTFAGWYTEIELTNLYRFTTMPSEDVTLYAKFVSLPPVITPNTTEYIIEASDVPIDFKDYFMFSDDYTDSDDLIISITYDDNFYTGSYITPDYLGDLNVSVSVVDEDGNTTTEVFVFTIVDTTAPVYYQYGIEEEVILTESNVFFFMDIFDFYFPVESIVKPKIWENLSISYLYEANGEQYNYTDDNIMSWFSSITTEGEYDLIEYMSDGNGNTTTFTYHFTFTYLTNMHELFPDYYVAQGSNVDLSQLTIGQGLEEYDLFYLSELVTDELGTYKIYIEIYDSLTESPIIEKYYEITVTDQDYFDPVITASDFTLPAGYVLPDLSTFYSIEDASDFTVELTHSIDSFTPGNYSLVITATDIYDNESSITVTVTVLPYANYDITFDTNGGSTQDTLSFDYLSLVVLPADPVKVGYTFAGWYTDSALTQVYEATTMDDQNYTLFAKWTANQYTISFDTDGVSVVADITQDFGTAVTVPTDPTKEGYTFDGWYTEIELANLYTFTTMPSEDVTLYAKWTVNHYTISFDTVGGSVIDDITQDFGTAVNAPVNPTKEGYLFNGWVEQIPATMPSENMTITALWIKVETQSPEIVTEVEGLLDAIDEALTEGKDTEVVLQIELQSQGDILESISQLITSIGGDELDIHSQGILYIDISVILKTEGEDDLYINQLTQMITITLHIPADQQGYSNYQIIRVHEGVAQVLTSVYNEETQTITFETDQFSTYAVIYDTYEGTWLWWLLLILLIPAAYVIYRYHDAIQAKLCYVVGKFKKDKDNKKEDEVTQEEKIEKNSHKD